MRGLRTLAACGLILGCGVNARSTQFRGPDGTDSWWVVRCDTTALCRRQAGESCPNGYDIDEKQPKRGAELIIRCKGPSAPAQPIDPACNTSPPRPDHCYRDEDAYRSAHRDYLPPNDCEGCRK